MQEICTYFMAVRGDVDEEIFNAASPQGIMVERVDQDTTIFKTTADQSGLIGLIRYLHNQGFVLISFTRQGGNEVGSVKSNQLTKGVSK